MTTIVTRAGKGDTLSWTEVDTNFTNLNTDKLENIVADTTPQLGGNLDVNGNSIVSTSNANIAISPNGTGKVVLDGVSWPASDGSANQVLTTNGSGTLSWTTPSSGSSVTMFSIRISGLALISGSTYRGEITEMYDPSNALSITSNQFSLATGTYLILLNGVVTNSGTALRLYNVTDSVNISNSGGFDMLGLAGGTVRTSGAVEVELKVGTAVAVTLAATKTVEFRMTNSADINMSATFIRIG
jgi:hypothetical protein